MNKRLLGQLTVFIVLIMIAGAIFFYYKESTKFSENSLNAFNKVIENLPDASEVTEGIEKIISTPEPIRAIIEAPRAHLTASGVLDWTNFHRQESGLTSLEINEKLSAAAELKLSDMFTDQYFEHVAPTGEGPADWIELSSYSFVSSGENLAEGNFENDQVLVQAWMDSPGHRENILNQGFEEIGIAVGQGEFEGRNTWLAVQMFTKPLSSCPQVSQELKDQIDANQVQLDSWQQEIELLRENLNQSRPKGRGANQNQIDEFNQLVEEYNQLVKSYNNLAESTKNQVVEYNQQVQSFNQCANN